MSDSGLADVMLGGAGVSVHVTLISSPKHDKSSLFRVHQVNVKVDGLKFSIRDSKHDFLYKTLRPLASGLIKRQIQKAIRDALVTSLEYVDGRLVDVKQRMDSARETEGQSQMEVLQDVCPRSLASSYPVTSTRSRYCPVRRRKNPKSTRPLVSSLGASRWTLVKASLKLSLINVSRCWAMLAILQDG